MNSVKGTAVPGLILSIWLKDTSDMQTGVMKPKPQEEGLSQS